MEVLYVFYSIFLKQYLFTKKKDSSNSHVNFFQKLYKGRVNNRVTKEIYTRFQKLSLHLLK